MERLTIPNVRVDEHTTRRSVIDVAAVREHAMEFYCRLKAYENTGFEPEEVTALGKLFDYALKESKTLTEQLALLNHIRELAEADKDGRVVVLPCRQGDELWTYCNHPVKRVYSFTVSDVSTLNGRTVLNTLGLGTIRPEDIGKTVFLSREEAEKALAEMEDKKNG